MTNLSSKPRIGANARSRLSDSIVRLWLGNSMPLAGPRGALDATPCRTGLLPVCYPSATGHASQPRPLYAICAGRQTLWVAAPKPLNGEMI